MKYVAMFSLPRSALLGAIPTTAGKFHFYCRNQRFFFESQRQKGMEGVLKVAL